MQNVRTAVNLLRLLNPTVFSSYGISVARKCCL